MTKFKVGDKVRVLDAEAIKQAVEKGFETGGIYSVSSIDSYGDPRLGVGDDELTLFDSELRYIEKVADKPTKNQRISTLESEVSALKAELAYVNQTVEALKQAQVRTDVAKIADRLAELVAGETIEPAQTPNELRKAIIAEARAFVADAMNRNYPKGSTPKITSIDESVWLDGTDAMVTDEVVFNVNAKKRTVVALIRMLDDCRTVVHRGIAKCAPGDVFNADIGKAIALGRALGLDVSKFEQAVQPTEVVAGQTTTYGKVYAAYPTHRTFGEDAGFKFTATDGFTVIDTELNYETWYPISWLEITDDTEAQYE